MNILSANMDKLENLPIQIMLQEHKIKLKNSVFILALPIKPKYRLL